MSGGYLFRREDNEELVEVPWDVMIRQDRAGFITLEGGVAARRCLHLEAASKPSRAAVSHTGSRAVVSDALGFGEHQFADFEQDRRKNGFTGVSFVRDQQVPEFYRVVCESRADFNRYAKHRGYVNKTGLGGVRFSQSDLDAAEAMVKRITTKVSAHAKRKRGTTSCSTAA